METLHRRTGGRRRHRHAQPPEKKNAINGPMWHELIEVFDEVADTAERPCARDHGRRRRVLLGRRPHPATTRIVESTPGDRRDASGRCASSGGPRSRLHELPQPTIAAVNGVAAGAGLQPRAGLRPHRRVRRGPGSPRSSRSAGLNVDFGGSWLLPRLVGLHKAKELVFLADIIDAAEAERIGIVNRVVPADDLDEVSRPSSRAGSPRCRRSSCRSRSGCSTSRSRCRWPRRSSSRTWRRR